MPVKRKLNKKRTKVPRNVKINSKSSKRTSQKKRGRRASRRQSGGASCTSEAVNNKTKYRLPPDSNIATQCCCTHGSYQYVIGAITNNKCVVAMDQQANCGDLVDTLPPTTVSTDPVTGDLIN